MVESAVSPQTSPLQCSSRYWTAVINREIIANPRSEYLDYDLDLFTAEFQFAQDDNGDDLWFVQLVFQRRMEMAGVLRAMGWSHGLGLREIHPNYAILNKPWLHMSVGQKSITVGESRNDDESDASDIDWDYIWEITKAGRFSEIPAEIRFKNYLNIKEIYQDYVQ